MQMQVLFCSTETGRSSFVRQLEPDWHVDTNPEIISQLAVSTVFHLNRYYSNCIITYFLIFCSIIPNLDFSLSKLLRMVQKALSVAHIY